MERILLVLFILVLQVETKCPPPEVITYPNGELQISSYDVGGTMRVLCDPGYHYTGTETRTCQLDGHWSGQVGSCQSLSCKHLRNDPNGDVHYTGLNYKDVATIICKIGYAYSEPSHRKRNCQRDYTWSGKNGKCVVIECPVLQKPGHGNLDMDQRYVNMPAAFSCDEGYKYNGTRVRMCGMDGQWSGRPGLCQAITCSAFQAMENGAILSNSTSFGSNIVFKCHTGYVLQGEKNITCMTAGWSGSPGKCLAVKNKLPQVLVPLLMLLLMGILAFVFRKALRRKITKCRERLNCKSRQRRQTPSDEGKYLNQNEPLSQENPELSITMYQNGLEPKAANGESPSNTLPIASGVEMAATTPVEQNLQELSAKGTEIASDGGSQEETFVTSRITPTVEISQEPTPEVTGAEGQGETLVVENPDTSKSTLTADSSQAAILSNGETPVGMASGGESTSEITVVKQKCQETTVSNDVLACPLDVESQKAAQTTPEKQNCVGKIFHFSFKLEDEIDIGDTQKDNKFRSKIEQRIKDINETFKVTVRHISQRRRLVFVDIECQPEFTVEKLKCCLNEHWKTENISPESLHFRDDVSNALALGIIKGADAQHGNQSDVDKKIDLDNQYMRLKVSSTKKYSTIQRGDREGSMNKVISDEDILSDWKVKSYVMMRGLAGIGKSTLLRRLMWLWAYLEWARHLRAIFLLNLRALMTMTAVDLPHLLSQYSVYPIDTNLDINWLQANERYIGIVLDGIDELSNFENLWNKWDKVLPLDTVATPVDWGFAIMKRKCLPKSTLIVTSRPFAGLNCLAPTMKIEVMGLTPDRVLEFVEKNVKPDRVNMVKNTLMRSPILQSVSTITFFCAALCKVLQEDIAVTDKLTTYTAITIYIMEMLISRSIVNSGESDASKVYEAIGSMCQLAYKGLLKSGRGHAQLVFDEKDYDNADHVEVARKAGLFLQTKTSDPKQVLGEFIHVSIQELLAMVGLLKQPLEDIKEALGELSSSGQFNMSLLFLYGIAFNRSKEPVKTTCDHIGCPDVSQKVCNLLIQNTSNIKDQLQVLQIVHESQSPEIARQVGRKRFPDDVTFKRTKLTVVDILALTSLLKYHDSTASIELKEVSLDSICLKKLSTCLQWNRNIKMLKLLDDGIDDDGMEYLADMLKINRSTLEKLEINSENVTDEGVKFLTTALKEHKSITQLFMWCSNVTDTGVEAISDLLAANTTLTELKVRSGKITDKGIEFLGDALKTDPPLKEMIITSESVTDMGIESLAACIESNTNLQTLKIQGTEVLEDGAKALLNALKKNQGVKLHFDLVCRNDDVRNSLIYHPRVKLHYMEGHD